MGWLRLVGSLKLQVSFANEPYERDYILRKSPIILRSLLIVATPYLSQDMTYSCGTSLIRMCDMTHSYVWPYSFIFVTCLIHTGAIQRMGWFRLEGSIKL